MNTCLIFGNVSINAHLLMNHIFITCFHPLARSPASLLPHRSTLSPPHPTPTPALSAHPGPCMEGLAPQWKQAWSGYPLWEMMDWRLTYGKGQGLQVNKHWAVLNMEEKKRKHVLPSLARADGEKETRMRFVPCALKPEADIAFLKSTCPVEVHLDRLSSRNKVNVTRLFVS